MPLHLVDIWSLMDEIGIEREIIDAIDPDAPLLTQGIDSIDFPALAIAVEKKFGVDISDTSAAKLRTLNDFVRFINEKAVT
ncbi:MAG TPA: phosphopantetheine-binding protein [Geobacteraceae bacterium]|nr:phosphopantetheine-binding protein [Geobacteraceae bacterium]